METGMAMQVTVKSMSNHKSYRISVNWLKANGELKNDKKCICHYISIIITMLYFMIMRLIRIVFYYDN